MENGMPRGAGSASGGIKFLIIIVILIAGGLGWHYRFTIQKYFHKLPELADSPFIQEIKNDISTPPPLIGSLIERESVLTVAGTVKWTNINRLENGNLPALKRNSKLDLAAQAKVNDMFKQQYFEHESPQGRGPADLAKAAGYEYISIGENLALGNFEDDEDLVTAWMNSPGHRANILSSKYSEIGVAVGRGKYEGRQVWLAVQEFGRPASSCPKVDSNFKMQIDFLKNEIKLLESQLAALKKELADSRPKTKAEYDAYNEKVAEYNSLVKSYNNKVDQLKLLTEQYNAQVRAYNVCLED